MLALTEATYRTAWNTLKLQTGVFTNIPNLMVQHLLARTCALIWIVLMWKAFLPKYLLLIRLALFCLYMEDISEDDGKCRLTECYLPFVPLRIGCYCSLGMSNKIRENKTTMIEHYRDFFCFEPNKEKKKSAQMKCQWKWCNLSRNCCNLLNDNSKTSCLSANHTQIASYLDFGFVDFNLKQWYPLMRGICACTAISHTLYA